MAVRFILVLLSLSSLLVITHGQLAVPTEAEESIIEVASNDSCTGTDCSSKSQPKKHNGRMALRKEIWVIPLIVLTSVNIIMLISFEFYVAVKTFGTVPNKRHLFLGQTLLFGLFISSAMGFVFCLEQREVTCGLIRFGLGVSYAVVFVTLLVKLVFLISLNTGVYLPANYQCLLVCFGIGIQLAIGVQWLVQQPPKLTADGGMCSTKFEILLLALIYDFLLLLTVTILAIKYRSIRDNHKEITFIGASVGFTILIWISWLVLSMVLDKSLRDACLAFGVVSNATMIFLVMFVPKRRQLAAMGEEGMYLDDRGSRLSNRSSCVAPSFFHIASPKTQKSEKLLNLSKPSLYDRTMQSQYGRLSQPAVPGRMHRYPNGYPTQLSTEYLEPHPDYYYHHYHHLNRPRMTSLNPNVHFYRGRRF